MAIGIKLKDSEVKFTCIVETKCNKWPANMWFCVCTLHDYVRYTKIKWKTSFIKHYMAFKIFQKLGAYF